jgi:membrane-associated phospholipid phosphatase
MRRLALGLAVFVAASLSGASPARAMEADPGPAYRLSVDLDVPLVLLGGTLAASYFLMAETPQAACAPRCDPSNVNVVDRPFAGKFNARWQTVGDVAVGATLVLVPATLFLGERWSAAVQDLLVVGESLLMTEAVQAPASYAVGRPRPRLYGDSAPVGERTGANTARSFFSGHVANTVAATLATTRALRRLGRSKLAIATLAVGLAGSALVGVARVEAGSHFPTDVLAGVAVGAAFGVAVPALHALELRPASLAGGHGIAVAGFF